MTNNQFSVLLDTSYFTGKPNTVSLDQVINWLENAHSFVWNAFSKFPREARKISAKGERLKYKRQQADYDSEVRGINNLTRAAIQEAEDISEAIKKLNN